MVNCENPDSISSSWDDINDFSTTNNKPVGKITISAELEQKLNNLIGSKTGSLNPTPVQKPVPLPPVPPPMPPLSLNTITNQQITRRKSLDSDHDNDNLTSVSVSSRRKKTLVIKKNRRLSLGNEPKQPRPLPRPSHICIETDLKSNEVKSPKYDLKMSVDRRQLHYLSVGLSFITGYLFCFYFGKSC